MISGVMCQVRLPRLLVPVYVDVSPSPLILVAPAEQGAGPCVETTEAADDAAGLEVIEVVEPGTARDRQYLRNDVEVQRCEECVLLIAALDVLEERVAVIALAGIVGGRPGRRRHVAEAAALARGGAGRYGLVHPVRVVEDFLVFPERADDAARAPVIGRAEPEFVGLVGIAQLLPPGCNGREARRGTYAAGLGCLAILAP